jgi:hypothetical protein
MSQKISIIVPTVDGREDHLERCLDAYKATTEDYEIIVYRNRPACGIAWQEGAEVFKGDYLHFTADDLEPHEGWAEAAMRSADDDIIPLDTLYNQHGVLDPLGPLTQGCSRVPFCTRAQWEKIGPMIPLHYYTDNWFSHKAKQAGYLIRETSGYTFTHHWAMPHRGAGMNPQARMIYDEQMFHQYVNEGYRV